jgi:hypothetical protein
MLIKPCSGINTFFMRFAIDAAFDRHGCVVGTEHCMRPWRIGWRTLQLS